MLRIRFARSWEDGARRRTSDPYLIASGLTEQDVTLATAANGKTVPQQWAVTDSSTHTVTGLILHLSPWFAAALAKPIDPCKADVSCAQKCCDGGQVGGDSCVATCTNGPDLVTFADCYEGCVKGPTAANFADSACLDECCTQANGTADASGACFTATSAEAYAAEHCGTACFKPGDTVTVCGSSARSCGGGGAGGTGGAGGGGASGAAGSGGAGTGGTGGGTGGTAGSSTGGSGTGGGTSGRCDPIFCPTVSDGGDTCCVTPNGPCGINGGTGCQPDPTLDFDF